MYIQLLRSDDVNRLIYKQWELIFLYELLIQYDDLRQRKRKTDRKTHKTRIESEYGKLN